jgi:hypothetical protein
MKLLQGQWIQWVGCKVTGYPLFQQLGIGDRRYFRYRKPALGAGQKNRWEGKRGRASSLGVRVDVRDFASFGAEGIAAPERGSTIAALRHR